MLILNLATTNESGDGKVRRRSAQVSAIVYRALRGLHMITGCGTEGNKPKSVLFFHSQSVCVKNFMNRR